MISKKYIITLLLMLGIFTGHAQEWMTDIEEAKKEASTLDRNIVLVFQGSDWCAPCMKLEKEIWLSEAFITYSKENFVLLKADFPKKRNNQLDPVQQEKNGLLAERYNTDGYFPLVVVLNAKGEVLGKTGYEKVSPTDYIKTLSSF